RAPASPRAPAPQGNGLKGVWSADRPCGAGARGEAGARGVGLHGRAVQLEHARAEVLIEIRTIDRRIAYQVDVARIPQRRAGLDSADEVVLPSAEQKFHRPAS